MRAQRASWMGLQVWIQDNVIPLGSTIILLWIDDRDDNVGVARHSVGLRIGLVALNIAIPGNDPDTDIFLTGVLVD